MSNGLLPFFTYYGGKWRISLMYDSPLFNKIIEPFAGSAGYSLRYPEKKVVLCDIDERICMIWEYLINASESDVLSLPIGFSHVDELNISEGAKYLIGFWLNKGASHPCKSPSKWMRSGERPKSYWGEEIRYRISSQLKYIRHWKIFNKSYLDIGNEKATWFIDPPYIDAGRHYRYGCEKIDYYDLSKWSVGRNGQVIVCENYGAKWLNFKMFCETNSTVFKNGKRKKSKEVVYYQVCQDKKYRQLSLFW